MRTPSRSTRLKVNGPVTDASISPYGSMLLLKTMTTVYAYSLAGSTVAEALGTTSCVIAEAAHPGARGYGEAITAGNDGGFYTVQESEKTLHSGAGARIWSFTP